MVSYHIISPAVCDMRSRPPRPSTPDIQAADAFIAGAERAAPPPTAFRQGPKQSGESDLPWEAPHVREDVVKGYALRLPEPLYLKLKWVAEQTGQSINALCREAVDRVVGEALTRLDERETKR